jgi:hypothetical protein
MNINNTNKNSTNENFKNQDKKIEVTRKKKETKNT